jgi:hypothetical protein
VSCSVAATVVSCCGLSFCSYWPTYDFLGVHAS